MKLTPGCLLVQLAANFKSSLKKFLFSAKNAEHYLVPEEDGEKEEDAMDGAGAGAADGGDEEGKRNKLRRKTERSSTFLKDFVRESMRSSHKRPKSSFS